MSGHMEVFVRPSGDEMNPVDLVILEDTKQRVYKLSAEQVLLMSTGMLQILTSKGDRRG